MKDLIYREWEGFKAASPVRKALPLAILAIVVCVAVLQLTGVMGGGDITTP